jgi:hypothetical protein
MVGPNSTTPATFTKKKVVMARSVTERARVAIC